MKLSTIVVTALILMTVGCDSVDRLVNGPEETKSPQPSGSIVTVSCCKISGTSTWPASVPESHRNYCTYLKGIQNDPSQWPNGILHQPMSVDCGNGHHDIGDEYY